MKYVLLCIAITIFANVGATADERDDGRVDRPQSSLAIADIDANMEGKAITVEFTVADTYGIAQLLRPGQAPSFGIKVESEHDTKRLTVWVVGELATVLERLQMSYLQANQLKKGTVIVATGTLKVHRDDRQSYSLHIDKWQKFRIVAPSKAR